VGGDAAVAGASGGVGSWSGQLARRVKPDLRRTMKLRALTCMTLFGLSNWLGAVPISITDPGVPYSQDFNSLASSGTGHSTLPVGWFIYETGPNADGLYRAGTGSSNIGDTYSFGEANSTDRALGGLRSSSLVPTFGAQFVNASSQVITAMTISYWGEQWRLGYEDRVDRLLFSYSLDASSLADGTWVRVLDLDFASPDVSDKDRRMVTIRPTGISSRTRLAGFLSSRARDGGSGGRITMPWALMMGWRWMTWSSPFRPWEGRPRFPMAGPALR
jgi:hypothetical protein